MAKDGARDWVSAVAQRAGVDVDRVQEVLAAWRIRAAPVAAAPRRLVVRRVAFSGTKDAVRDAGPFKFEWQGLEPGLWGLITDSNLKGKSSVIEIVRWMLRGRPSETLQEDVRRWVGRCTLRFDLDETAYEVRAETTGHVTGELVRVDDRRERTLAAFSGESEFEAVMSDFFMRELNLEAVTRWTGGGESEGGKAVLHGWPSLSSAMFIGTDYSSLLGNIPVTASLSTPLMQMYLGLPWISTLTAAKSALQGARRERDAWDRRNKADQESRKVRTDVIRRALDEKRAELATTPSDQEVRAELSRVAPELAAAKSAEGPMQDRVSRDSRALSDAVALHAADRQELQAHLDAEAAGAVFRMLDPSCCPRCDAAVSDDRRRNEKSTHSCSVCGEHIVTDAGSEAIQEALEGHVRASRSGVEKAKRDIVRAEEEHSRLRARTLDLDARANQSLARLATFGVRHGIETEIAVLAARLAEAGFETHGGPQPTDELAVLDALVRETDARVKSVQDEVLEAVSERLAHYARRFGMVNLASAQLRGNATLPLVKGGESTSYSKVTAGEKLRLKVAAVLAIISVAEARGVGRYPGLLFIDSPGAQEVSQQDLAELVKGLAEVSRDLGCIQIFIAARASPAVLDQLPKEHARYAVDSAALW